MTTIRLGPFALEERLGEGGMGAVHRGRHRRTGLEVALKVIRGETDEGARERFRREVQAHAGLLHPNVVHLFEYGTVDAAAAGASDGELDEGSPFVAMELAGGGTVRDLLPLDRWPAVRAIVVQILDGLAFSHARGVIHRDLKPENFLVFERDEAPAPRIKLADFGIAHALEAARDREEDSLGTLAGTPPYMAPEQARGEWRRYGAWTDLYALGCIVWELVCGRVPFRADRPLGVVIKHLERDRPPLEPRFAVPDGLEAWIHRAMAIDPERRFRRAADAARALPDAPTSDAAPDDAPDELATRDTLADGPALDDTAPDDRKVSPRGPTLSATRADPPAPTVQLDEPDAPDASRPSSAPDAPRAAAESWSIPASYRVPRGGRRPKPVVGTGLGLFGLREIPFVDRDAERDELWEALREVERDASLRLVVVVGESGAGKSRLVDWIATRTHELGAAKVLRAIHTEGGAGPAEGVGGAVRRMFNAWRLDRDELYETFLEELPPLDERDRFRETDARALTELISPSTDRGDEADGPRYRFSSPGQQDKLVARLIGRFARRRLPLVWIDDAHWNPRLLRGVEHIACHSSDPPSALVVLTLRAEALADDPALAERIERMAASDRARRIELERLALDDHRRLLDRILPLEPALADRLAERTEGNPLFAAQMIGEWIEHGQLEDGPAGFRRPAGAELEVPDDIHGLWMSRLERAIEDLDVAPPDRLWEMLELAAALGREVDGGEWRRVCSAGAAGGAGDLRDELIERGLADRAGDGWSFTHGLLVDSLERRARDRGRWASHNRRCAEALGELYPDPPPQTAARRADHLREAGEPERGIELLGAVAERLLAAGDPQARRTVLTEREWLFDAADLPDDDPRRTVNAIQIAYCDLFAGRDPEAIRSELREIYGEPGARDEATVCKALRVGVQASQHLGEFAAADRLGERAIERARSSGDEHELIRTLCTVGWTAHYRGHPDRAAERFEEARRLATRLELPYWRLHATRSLAAATVGTGDSERARELFRRVAREARDHGLRETEAQALNGLGELARLEGDLEEARDYYERFAERCEELNNRESQVVALLNSTLVELDAGRFEAAGEQLARCERLLERLSIEAHRHLIELAHLARTAGRGEWSEFDRRFEAYADGWPDEARLENDHPWLLELAGECAADHDQPGRARRTRELAAELWGRLGDEGTSEGIGQSDNRTIG